MCVWNILEQVARFFWGVCTVYWDPVGICLCVQHLQVLLYLSVAIRSLAYLRVCEQVVGPGPYWILSTPIWIEDLGYLVAGITMATGGATDER